MKKYRGYYIDHFYFHNEAEIDEFVKKQAIERYRTLCRIFSRRTSPEALMAISVVMGKHADLLHKVHGLSHEEIENIEIEVFSAA